VCIYVFAFILLCLVAEGLLLLIAFDEDIANEASTASPWRLDSSMGRSRSSKHCGGHKHASAFH
jgi:hypothetical protein